MLMFSFWHHLMLRPPLIRLPGVVARNRKICYKALQKSLRKHLGQFFAKVNTEVTEGHQRSNLAKFYIFREMCHCQFYGRLLFLNLFDTLRKFRKASPIIFDRTIIYKISSWKCYFIDQIYLKEHFLPETTNKSSIKKRPALKTFRNFRNVSKSFENHNPSWKQLLSLGIPN